MNPVHRIEPRLFTVPEFYGSAGEPTLGRLPRVQNPMQMGQAPSGGLLGMLAAGLLGGGMISSKQAQTPLLAQIASMEKPNDEPLDVMPDKLKFKQAFAKARKMGLEIFTWRGKDYTTKLKE